MKKRATIIIVVLVALAAGWWLIRHRRAKAQPEEEYIETARVERGPLVVTVEAPGKLEPLTTVEVKSRVGGEIKKLYVDRGDRVKAGQLIAQIDPRQVESQVAQRQAEVDAARARLEQAKLNAENEQAAYEAALKQAQAAYDAAVARVRQAEEQLRLARESSQAQITQAKASLEAAKARLEQARTRAKAQPAITDATIAQRKAAVAAAQENLNRLLAGSRPQEIAEAEAAVKRAKAVADNAARELERMKKLYAKGFVSRQQLDQAQENYDTAQAQLEQARAQLDLAKEGPRKEEIEQARAQLEQAKAALRQAEAQRLDVQVAQQEEEAAEAAVAQAEASLASAQASAREVQVREKDLQQARAALQQAKAELERARKQRLQVEARRKDVAAAQASLSQAVARLEEVAYNREYTRVVAPRDGIILDKLLEEGTVVPAGTALYSQGAVIVTLADTSKMYVLAQVDESDIGQVKPGQKATVEFDVIPGRQLRGKVIKIYPKAQVEQDVVYYMVRVLLLDVPPQLRPGMTANVRITVASLKDVLKIPDRAIDRSGGKTTVEVLVNGQRQKREIKIGLTNWEETQVLEGLKEGEEVILPSISPPMFGPGAQRGGGRDRGRTARRSMFILSRGRRR